MCRAGPARIVTKRNRKLDMSDHRQMSDNTCAACAFMGDHVCAESIGAVIFIPTYNDAKADALQYGNAAQCFEFSACEQDAQLI